METNILRPHNVIQFSEFWPVSPRSTRMFDQSRVELNWTQNTEPDGLQGKLRIKYSKNKMWHKTSYPVGHIHCEVINIHFKYYLWHCLKISIILHCTKNICWSFKEQGKTIVGIRLTRKYYFSLSISAISCLVWWNNRKLFLIFSIIVECCF